MRVMKLRKLIEEKLTDSVIGAFFDVYNTLGFGFLESLYARALEHELPGAGIAWRARSACPSSTRGGRWGTNGST